MFVLFKRFLRLSKPVSFQSSFLYLFFSHLLSLILFLFNLKSRRIFIPQCGVKSPRGKPVGIWKIHFYIGIAFFLFLVFFLSCERDFSSIEKVTDPFALVKPTSHDFNWEIDTLGYEGAIQIIPSSIWGSDTNNIWLVGHSDTYKARIWHYNGTDWEPFVLLGLSVHPRDIIGFNKDDVWAIGDFPTHILHWNGNKWMVIDFGINNRYGMSIWGSSSSDLFFGFDDGLLASYDGNNLKTFQTETKAQIVDLFGFSYDDVYACGIEHDNKQPLDSTYYYIFHFNGKTWEITNSHLLTINNPNLNFPYNGLWGNKRGILFGANGRNILISSNKSEWTTIFEPETSVRKIHGTDINNIFVTGYWGSSIYHFNGQTWKNYDELRDLDFFGWAVFVIRDRVFIGGDNSYDHNAYVIRGKRK